MVRGLSSQLKRQICEILRKEDLSSEDIVERLKSMSEYRKTGSNILKTYVEKILDELKPKPILKKRETMEPEENNKEQKKTVLFDDYPVLSFDQLGGLEEQKESIRRFIEINIKNNELYSRLGFDRALKNIVINGPIGSGKTSLALATADLIGYDRIKLNLYDDRVYSSLRDNKLKSFLKLIIQNQPCTIIFDDFDSFFGKEGSANKDQENKIIANLHEFFEKTKTLDVIIIATVSKIEKIKQNFIRPGRFEFTIDIGLPEEKERQLIIETMLKDKVCFDINHEELAHLTSGFVAVDLENMIHKAGELAIERYISEKETQPKENGHKESVITIQANDFIHAIGKTSPIFKREGFTTVPSIKWDDIGALSNLKTELEKLIVRPIKEPELCIKFGIKRQAGVLLYGPPGCGKTMLAKAVAHECKANFIYVKGPELLSKYFGESEKSVRGLFERAKLSAPCLIFFDEIDGLCPKRSTEGNQVIERVVNQLLTEMNGLDDMNQVYLIGATNRPDIIDRAILRPERLGVHLYVPMPAKEDRLDIIKTIIKKKPVDSVFDVEAFLNKYELKNYSGADLNALVEAAARNAAWGDEGRHEINTSDFEHAVKNSKPSMNVSDIEYYATLYKTFK